MTIQTDFSTTFYVALGDYDGTLSAIAHCHMNLADAADDYVDAMAKGYITRGWVLEVQTGKDVTEAAKAMAREWIARRSGDCPAWLDVAA